MSKASPNAASTALATCAALVAFAANSLLCRVALKGALIDASSFTAVRIVSGAVVLALIVTLRRGDKPRYAGSWLSGAALFAYAIAFSWAYVDLNASVGALLLFGSVQLTMIGVGLARGERPRVVEWIGLALALAGLCYYLVPGVSAPPLRGAALMIGAGIAWGIYSLRGRGASDPIATTAGNFVCAAPLAILPLVFVALLPTLFAFKISLHGLLLAVTSGAITSGLGYVIWYRALPGLTATRAALVQLAVPPLTALAAILFLGEVVKERLPLATLLILGGISLAILGKARR